MKEDLEPLDDNMDIIEECNYLTETEK